MTAVPPVSFRAHFRRIPIERLATFSTRPVVARVSARCRCKSRRHGNCSWRQLSGRVDGPSDHGWEKHLHVTRRAVQSLLQVLVDATCVEEMATRRLLHCVLLRQTFVAAPALVVRTLVPSCVCVLHRSVQVLRDIRCCLRQELRGRNGNHLLQTRLLRE